MASVITVNTTEAKFAIQVPVQGGLNTIVNTGLGPVLLCKDNSFSPDFSYTIQPGTAIPWEDKTCFAILVTGTQGSLWVSNQLFYGTTGVATVQQMVPTLSVSVPTSAATVLAAPVAGGNYLFGADLAVPTGAFGAIVLDANGGPIAWLAVNDNSAGYGTDHVDLNGFRASTAVAIGLAAGQLVGSVILRYTTGP